MKTLILSRSWFCVFLLAAVQGSALAQAHLDSPDNVECAKITIARGFITTVQSHCDLLNLLEDKNDAEVRECARYLGRSSVDALLVTGQKAFERLERELGHDQVCEDTRVKIPGLIEQKLYTELTRLNTKVHEQIDAGKMQDALKTSRKLELEARGSLGTDHPIYTMALKALVVSLMQNALYAEAVPLQYKLLIHQEQIFGKDSNDVAESLHNLAETLSRLDRAQEAEPILRQALNIHQNVQGSDSGQSAETMLSLAIVLSKQKNTTKPKNCLSTLSIFLNESMDQEAAELPLFFITWVNSL
jgi:tetratricopeptide (TPR) repeat protein